MKTYPDRTFEEAARKAGAPVQCLWEMKGPRNTAIAWLSALSVNGRVVIVQTYTDGNGWEVYSPAPTLNVDATIQDALARCGVVT
jgi:hypothetical protein